MVSESRFVLNSPIAIQRPFSNYAFIDEHFAKVEPLRRLMSQVRQHGGQSMIVERLDSSASDDLCEENSDIHTRFPSFSSDASHVHRISFYSAEVNDAKMLSRIPREAFLGYAIVKTDVVPGGPSCSRIYESIIRRSRRPNNFIRGEQRWSCLVGGEQFEIPGYIYAQQNNMTNVCAHVALRTAAARFHADGDMLYREMNAKVGIDHKKRKVGGSDGGGLDVREIEVILKAAGANCFIGRYDRLPPSGTSVPLFQEYLYGSIESGYPAIIFFGTTTGHYHVIPTFGHTFNEDTWVPNAVSSYFRVGRSTRYLRSESWLSTYVAHDDNWGSNFCVPRQFLHTQMACEGWPEGRQLCPGQQECVVYVISTVPQKVKLNPVRAGPIGADYLFSILRQLKPLRQPWGRRLRYYAQKDLLVLRPILITVDQYADHLEKLSDWDSRAIEPWLIDAIRATPPEYVWMVELSVPELFSANRRKIGEVLIHAETAPGSSRDFSNFFLARLPGYFAVYLGGTASSPRFRFVPSGASGHTQLFGCE
jgi:hypothetical protein